MPKPLRGDLPPEIRRLAEFLRMHFDQLPYGVREYARRRHWNPGTVSRFLCGDRIAPLDFIYNLLDDAGPQRTGEQVEQDRRKARELRADALRLRNARAAESERIALELSDVEHEIHLGEVRERALSEALLAKQQEYESLLQRYQRLRAEQDSSNSLTAIESGQQALDRVARERDRSQKVISELKQDLARERQARHEAEDRRDQLRVALDRANAELVRTGGTVIEVTSRSAPEQLMQLLGENQRRFGGLTNLAAVWATMVAAPAYLGLAYHQMVGAPGYLETLTVLGIAIPAWFSYRVLVLRGGSAHRPAQATAALAFSVVLFFLGILIGIIVGR